MYTKKRKGISPVIATVILIAVAVAIAIAVAFWAAGLTGAFTRFEKLEISSAYANSATSIVLNVQNTGSSDATIVDIFINGKPESSFVPAGTAAPVPPISLTSGSKQTITITIAAPGLTSGVTYDFKVHTAAGNDYPKAVVIP